MLYQKTDGWELEINVGRSVYSGYENGPGVFCEWEELSEEVQTDLIRIENDLTDIVSKVPDLEECEE